MYNPNPKLICMFSVRAAVAKGDVIKIGCNKYFR